MIHPVIINILRNPFVTPLLPTAWGAGGSTLPRLAPGEYYLTDERGNYLTDENGAYLIGKDA